jgi:ribosomal protein S18 acetylase RimI-like enzyme
MTEITIHSTEKEDFSELFEIDHSYHTDHVWQMDLQEENNEWRTTFRTIRLPRSMRVEYPYLLTKTLKVAYKNHLFFTARINNEIAGYCNFVINPFSESVNFTDLIVKRRFRRKGVGSKLLSTVLKWIDSKNINHAQSILQSKNFPAIQLFLQFGFEYSGYNDKYFANQDIAIIFNKRL